MSVHRECRYIQWSVQASFTVLQYQVKFRMDRTTWISFGAEILRTVFGVARYSDIKSIQICSHNTSRTATFNACVSVVLTIPKAADIQNILENH